MSAKRGQKPEHTVRSSVYEPVINGAVAQVNDAGENAEGSELEGQLSVNEEHYRSLVATSAQIFWTIAVDGTLDDAPTWRAYTGQSREEIRGHGWLKTIHPDDLGCVEKAWKKALATRGNYEAEYRVRRYDGVYRTFETRGSPVFDDDGRIREWMGASTDITGRRQLEDELRESEQRFRVTFEQAAVGMAHIGLDGRWLLVNQKLCDMLGYTREELLQLTFHAVIPSEDLPVDLAYANSILAGELPSYSWDKRYVRKDGSLIWVNVMVTLMRDAQDTPLYFIVVTKDITEAKRVEEERAQFLARAQQARAEAAAHASELEAIFQAAVDALVVYDSAGRIQQMNQAAHDLFGMDSFPDYVSLPFLERMKWLIPRDEDGRPIPDDMLPATRILRGEVLKDANAAELIFRNLHGNDVVISTSGTPIRDHEDKIIGAVTISRNVTARRRLERRTHDTLKALLAMAESLVLIPGEAPASPEEDALSLSGSRVVEYTSSTDEVAKHLTSLTRSVLGCERVGVFVVEPPSDALVPLAVVGYPFEQNWQMPSAPRYALSDSPTLELLTQLRSNEVLLIDMEQPGFNLLPNPYAVRVVLIAPLNVSGQLIGILTVDYGGAEHEYTPQEIALAKAVAQLSALVIERRRLLQERAEAQAGELAQREANRRMDEFLGIVSHELRTPLTTINANIQLAARRLRKLVQQETLDAGEKDRLGSVQDLLGRAEHQVEVLNRLVSDLIDISRIQADKLELHMRHEACDLATIVREAVQNQRQMLPERDILLVTSQAHPLAEMLHPLAPVVADSDRIGQVVTNYLTNALKYSASEMPVEVHLRIEDRVARVSVRDSGPGLSPVERDRVWERFYRVRGIEVQSGSGVGLGLGLHISRTIIERHRGQVGVESTPGVGSTFWFTLPLAEE